jgi:non-specific serine/threonine protein kinase
VAEHIGDSGLQARALLESGVIQLQQGTPPRVVTPQLDRAETLARGVTDWRVVLRVHLNRGGSRMAVGDFEGYRAETRQAVALGEKFVQTRGPASYLAEACLYLGDWHEGRAAARLACAPGRILSPAHQAMLAWMEGDHSTALQLLRDAVADGRSMGVVQYVVQYLGILADGALQVALLQEALAAAREAPDVVRARGYWGDADYAIGPFCEAAAWARAHDAESLLNEAVTLLDRLEHDQVRPQVLRARGLVALTQGRLPAALEALDASVEMARRHHTLPQLGRTLVVVARAAELTGDAARSDSARAELAEVVRRIGADELRGLIWATGETVVPLHEPDSDKRSDAVLTRREREVAALVARGFTNRQIGEALVIAEGTAGVHVDHILTKLGFHSRAQIAAFIAERGNNIGR